MLKITPKGNRQTPRHRHNGDAPATFIGTTALGELPKPLRQRAVRLMTGTLGTLTPVLTAFVTGVEAAGALGTLTPSVEISGVITGVAATGQVGEPLPSITKTISGVGATGELGSLTVISGVAGAITGAAALGQVGQGGHGIAASITGVQALPSPRER